MLSVLNLSRRRCAAARAWRHVALADALRGGVVCTVPALLAAYLHMPLLSWSAIAAFWTCFTDPGGTLRTRLAFALPFGVAGALASGLASYAGVRPPLAVALAAAVGFCGAFARAGGPRVGLPALLVATAFGVATAFPGHDMAHAIRYAAYFLGGNLWALGFGMLLWRGDAHAPVRRALAACLVELADLATELSRCIASASIDHAMTAATCGALRARVRGRLEVVDASVRAGSQRGAAAAGRALPAQELALTAEQAFVALVGLEHLLAPEAAAAPPAVLSYRVRASIAAALAVAADLMAQIALACKSARPELRDDIALGLIRLDAATGRFQSPNSGLFALSGARFDAATLAAVFSRLRGAMGRAQAMLWPERGVGSAVAAAESELRSGWQAYRAQLAANLHGDSSWFRYALRVALGSAIAVGVVRYYAPDHGYWLILTMFFTLQPHFATTLKVSAQRVGGTLLGAVLVAALGVFVQSPLLLALLVFPFSVGTLAARTVSYLAYMLFLTPHFILVAELGQPGLSAPSLALMRISNSFFGAALAVGLSLLVWPNWESKRAAHVLAAALEASARYVAAALRAASASADAGGALAGLRRQACIAVDQAEAAMARMRVEPRVGTRWAVDDQALIATLRSVIGAATLIELSVATADPAASTDRIAEFARWVDGVMERSCARLRGDAPVPEVAEDHPPPQCDARLPVSMRNTLQRIASSVDTVRGIALGKYGAADRHVA